MFNLLIFNVDWKSTHVKLPKERFFEHTAEHIKKQFKNNNDILFEKLKIFPCLFCKEGQGDEPVYFGWIDEIEPFDKNYLSLKIRLDMDMPELKNKTLYDFKDILFINEYEFNRNHLSVKNVNIYEFIIKNILVKKNNNGIFKINHCNVEQDLLSVMMPFDQHFKNVYDSINNTSDNFGLRCERADTIWNNDAIIEDIFELIARSRIVVCDCTGKNPNVFYEMGIAHTLNKDVIIITQNNEYIPFDIRHIRHITYLNNTQGLLELSNKLQERIQTLLNK